MRLGKFLKQKRNSLGMTQRELSGKTGLSRVGIANIESDRQSPSFNTVIVIMKHLEMSQYEIAEILITLE